MSSSTDLLVFFNFRSPYCYLASKTMFDLFDEFHVNLVWKPLGGWNGRSAPDKSVRKVPLARQDVQRFCRRLGIPFHPPPRETEPTRAGAGSLLAEARGLLRPYVIEMMRAEWAEGRNIGDTEVLRLVARRIGLDPDELITAADDPSNHNKLEDNWRDADRLGVVGVPSFVVKDQIFWGNDRITFVQDYLRELGLRRL